MGLFSKKKQQEELELPPPPPPISEGPSELELPPVPSIEDLKEDLPREEEQKPSPKFMGGKIKTRLPPTLDLEDLEKELPPVPPIENLREDLPNLREMGNREIQRLEFPEIKEEEEPGEVTAGPIEELETEETEEQPERRVVEGPIYLNVKSFKDTIDNINMIRSKIKESEDYIERINEIKNMKDKYFEQLRTKLEDLQRKSMYIDKSLFEGVK
jgi:hypothetical protein